MTSRTDLAALVPGALLVLTEDDQRLIDRARADFRSDFRYLEQILWQARSRRTVTNPQRLSA